MIIRGFVNSEMQNNSGICEYANRKGLEENIERHKLWKFYGIFVFMENRTGHN